MNGCSCCHFSPLNHIGQTDLDINFLGTSLGHGGAQPPSIPPVIPASLQRPPRTRASPLKAHGLLGAALYNKFWHSGVTTAWFLHNYPDFILTGGYGIKKKTEEIPGSGVRIKPESQGQRAKDNRRHSGPALIALDSPALCYSASATFWAGRGFSSAAIYIFIDCNYKLP